MPQQTAALQEWAHLQLLDDGPRLFYNDIHEYFLYMLCVPYVPEDASKRGLESNLSVESLVQPNK